MSKFYINNNRIFSDKELTLKFLQIEPNIQIDTDTSNLIDSNKEILEVLENIQKSKKELKISGIVSNFEELKEKIKKTSKDKFVKIQENDYEFIEKTSSLEILEQIEKSLSYTPIMRLKEKIKSYIEDVKGKEDKKIKTFDEQIEKLKIELDSKQKVLDRLNIQVQELEKINIDKEREIAELKRKIENSLNKKNENKDVKKKTKALEKKIEFLKSKIEEIEMEIKILHEQINVFTQKLKLGDTKSINLVLMILTLGLIYWTKYSDNRYILGSIKLKIAKRKEKMLKLELQIRKIEREIELLIKEDLEKNLKDYKTEEKIEEEKSYIKIKIAEIEKEILKESKKLEEKEKELKNIENDVEEVEEKVTSLIKVKENYKEFSVEKIERKIKEIEEEYSSDIKEVERLVKILTEQRVEVNGSWTIEF